MSSTVTIKNNNQEYSGKLILTQYGKSRILERISQGDSFTTFNFTSVALGDKINHSYTPSIKNMGNGVASYPISDENVFIEDYSAVIKVDLDLEGEITVQEIGLYETVNNKTQLFAYASGFSMIKGSNISYNLIVDLKLSLAFTNEHYSKYETVFDDTEYALMPRATNLFSSLTKAQLDLERCIEINARELAYNKAQSFMLEEQYIGNILRNILLLGRYEKIITRFGVDDITDCFFYPSQRPTSYIVKNLKDDVEDKYEDIYKNLYILEVSDDGSQKYLVNSLGEQLPLAEEGGNIGFYNNGKFVTLTKVAVSEMNVTGELQLCNRDNVDLNRPSTIVYTTQLNTMTKENIIFGKMNPNADEYYFDLRMIYDKNRDDYGLQFTIYSYDKQNAVKGTSDERKLVGHYRIKYFPTQQEKVNISTNETMFTFVYNGNIDEPEVKMYLGTKAVHTSENFIVDNFNYMGPCQAFRDSCTLRNYSQTVSTSDFKKPMYYLIPEIDNSSIVVFKKELSESDILYLSLISQS